VNQQVEVFHPVVEFTGWMLDQYFNVWC